MSTFGHASVPPPNLIHEGKAYWDYETMMAMQNKTLGPYEKYIEALEKLVQVLDEGVTLLTTETKK